MFKRLKDPKVIAGIAALGTGASAGCLLTDNPIKLYVWATMMPLTSWMFNSTQHERKKQLFKGVKGRVLEINPNVGGNFSTLPTGTFVDWTGVESNKYVLDNLKENAGRAGFPAINLEILNTDTLEGLKTQKDESFDSVVTSLGLSRTKDIDQTLSEVKRVLKPGGKLYFVEYSSASNPLTRVFQTLTTPLTFAFTGVVKSHPIAQSIAKAGFERTHIETWPSDVDPENARKGVRLVKFDKTTDSFESGKTPKGIWKCTIAGICVKEGGKTGHMLRGGYSAMGRFKAHMARKT